MLELYGKKEEIWELDAGLAQVARDLIQENPGLDYIDLDAVVFCRVDGSQLKKDGRNWLGKTWYLRQPISIVINYAFQQLRDKGLLDFTKLGAAESLLGIRYIIALNTDAILEVGSNTMQQEKIVLHHELLHIRVDNEGLVPHPVQDFATILEKYGIFWTNGVFKQGSVGPQQKSEFLSDFASKLKVRSSDLVESSD